MPDRILREGIAREELAGLAYMFWTRLIALGVLAIWLAATLPFERSGLYILAIAAFAILGAPPYFLARNGLRRTWISVAFLLLDAGLLTYILIVPAPFSVEGWTSQLNLRLPSFIYLAVFLVGMALSYSPALVLGAGVAVITTWSTGYLWVAALPSSVTHTSGDMLDEGMSSEAVLQAFLNPDAVSLTTLSNQIVFLGLVTLILTLAVWRSRRLLYRQVAAEAQRSILSRYFSPNIVQQLATDRETLDRTTVQPVAVLFADMVGFTGISERLSPDALVSLLSDFHGRLARVAFAHDGTVDKYIGDAIMIHFGTPSRKPDDAARALACAAGMIEDMKRWNIDRQQAGQFPVDLGIGLHYGDAVVGNIGDARRLEYTVLGDTVNVASRLERLTRETGTVLVASDDLYRAVQACGVDPHTILATLHEKPSHTVRGRRDPVAIWTASATST